MSSTDEKSVANYMRMSGMKNYSYDYASSNETVKHSDKKFHEKDQRESILKTARKNSYEDAGIFIKDSGVSESNSDDATNVFTQSKSSIDYNAVYDNIVSVRSNVGPDEMISDGLVLKLLSHKMSERLEATIKGKTTVKMNNDRKDEFIYDISPIAPGETMINKRFLSEIKFDGYQVNLSGDNSNRHLFFNMGLGFGESAVLNPLFQSHPNDDLRTHPRFTKIGRLYSRVYDSQVILSLIPGTIKYHTNLLKLIGFDGGISGVTASYIRSSEGLMSKLGSIAVGFGDTIQAIATLGSAAFGGGKVSEFVKQPNLYRKYFDNLVISVATQMGLFTSTGGYVGKYSELSLNTIMPGISLRYYTDWVKGWNYNHILKFRINNQISVSESFSNSSTSNPLMDSLNSESTEAAADNQTGNLQSSMDTAKNIFGAVLSGDQGNIVQSVTKAAGGLAKKATAGVSQITMIKGGKAKMTFPNAYESSSFSRSYTFNFEFFSPYGDKLSIFENTYVPALALLALALPRQVGGFTYIEPFAVRAFVAGQVNINQGMIESLSFERGSESNDYTSDYLPRTLKASLQISDMEPNLLLPLGSRSILKNIVENVFPASGLSEYLATMSGLTLEDISDWRVGFRTGVRKWTAQMRASVGLEDLQSSIAGNQIVSNISSLFGIIGPGNKLPDAEENYDADMIASTDPKAQQVNNGIYGVKNKNAFGAAFEFAKGIIPNINLTKILATPTEDNKDLADEGKRLSPDEWSE